MDSWKPWNGLIDLIEDSRHLSIRLRRWLSKDDLARMSTTPRILVDASNRAIRSMGDVSSEDRQEVAAANFLIGQYEEALTFLGSMSIQ